MSFKDFSIFSCGGHFVEGNGTIFAISVDSHPRNIKLFENRATDMSFKAFAICTSGGQFCSVEWNNFSNLCRGSPKDYFCEIILKSGHWSWRRCRLKVFLSVAVVAFLFSGGEPF